MVLRELLEFDSIVIQCHNNPDADAIASGWAVQRWLESRGKSARLVYGGPDEIQKSNLRIMLQDLGISIQHVRALDPLPDLLLIVDGTYKSGKVEDFSVGKDAAAVIDHHEHNAKEQSALPKLHEVRNKYGSCSTIIWDLLRQAEGEDWVKKDERLATALYYGLLMDTNRLENLSDPMDIEMRNDLESHCLKKVLDKLKYNNLSPRELRIVGRALANSRYDLANRFSVAEAEPCDPNILGVISDRLTEVENTDVCVVYCMEENCARLSVRSCTWQVQANVLASELTDGIGGGHEDKAGGPLFRDVYNPEDEDREMDSERVFWYLWDGLKRYFKMQTNCLSVRAEVTLSRSGRNELARADVTLGGCLTVKGLRVRNGAKGLFVGMPGTRGGDGQFHDVCFPITAPMRRAIQDTVLCEYRRALGETVEEPEGLEDISPDKLDLSVKVYPQKNAGTQLAFASVRLGNCFAVKGLRVLKSQYGPFVAMPSWQDSKKEYHNICIPATEEMKKRLQEAVLEEYSKAVSEK